MAIYHIWDMCSCVVASCKRWICILHDQKQAEESKAFISNFIKNSSKGGFNCQFDLVHSSCDTIYILLAFLVSFLV